VSTNNGAVPVDEAGRMLPGVLRVLFVCTGNICRSPIAEHLMRDSLHWRVGADARWVQVASAGTSALVGQPMESEAAATLAGLGVRGAEHFRARQVTDAMIHDADIVLTAERSHRAVVVDLVPSVVRRAFTLLEFDRLLAAVAPDNVAWGTPRERGLALAHAATAMRGLIPYAEPEDDDIVDPYRRPRIEFERVAAEVGRSLTRPLDLLTGARP